MGSRSPRSPEYRSENDIGNEFNGFMFQLEEAIAAGQNTSNILKDLATWLAHPINARYALVRGEFNEAFWGLVKIRSDRASMTANAYDEIVDTLSIIIRTSTDDLSRLSTYTNRLTQARRIFGAAGYILAIADTAIQFQNSPEAGLRRLTRHTVRIGAGVAAQSGSATLLASVAGASASGGPPGWIVGASILAGVVIGYGVDVLFDSQGW